MSNIKFITHYLYWVCIHSFYIHPTGKKADVIISVGIPNLIFYATQECFKQSKCTYRCTYKYNGFPCTFMIIECRCDVLLYYTNKIQEMCADWTSTLYLEKGKKLMHANICIIQGPSLYKMWYTYFVLCSSLDIKLN